MSRNRLLEEIQEDIRTLTRVPSEFIHAKLNELAEEEYGFGFWKDLYDPVTLGFLDSEFETMEELNYEKVLYWMPMIEPPLEEEEEDETN
mgnify:CR=1 FL=1